MTILKQKDFSDTKDPRLAAGDKQEKDVAFYLRRAFKDDENILVLNDFRFTFNDEVAQIDHLIVHRAGFIIIESKSIYGEVKVNTRGEWSRSYKGQWSGMPSPIIQAGLQKDLLRQLLINNVELFLGKLLGIQTQVRYREWAVLCTVSNNCILHREEMPSDISKQVIKSESISDEVKKIGGYSKLGSAFSTKPYFSQSELNNIGQFLLDTCQSKPNTDELKIEEPKISFDDKTITISQPIEIVSPSNTQKSDEVLSTTVIGIACKNCDEKENLTAKYGKFGYYVQCGSCDTNTSMKTACPECGNTKTRIKKQADVYWLSCDCSMNRLLFVQPK